VSRNAGVIILRVGIACLLGAVLILILGLWALHPLLGLFAALLVLGLVCTFYWGLNDAP